MEKIKLLFWIYNRMSEDSFFSEALVANRLKRIYGIYYKFLEDLNYCGGNKISKEKLSILMENKEHSRYFDCTFYYKYLEDIKHSDDGNFSKEKLLKIEENKEDFAKYFNCTFTNNIYNERIVIMPNLEKNSENQIKGLIYSMDELDDFEYPDGERSVMFKRINNYTCDGIMGYYEDATNVYSILNSDTNSEDFWLPLNNTPHLSKYSIDLHIDGMVFTGKTMCINNLKKENKNGKMFDFEDLTEQLDIREMIKKNGFDESLENTIDKSIKDVYNIMRTFQKGFGNIKITEGSFISILLYPIIDYIIENKIENFPTFVLDFFDSAFNFLPPEYFVIIVLDKNIVERKRRILQSGKINNLPIESLLDNLKIEVDAFTKIAMELQSISKFKFRIVNLEYPINDKKNLTIDNYREIDNLVFCSLEKKIKKIYMELSKGYSYE